jgi:SNF2 family DNA or RNA helicase
MQPIENKQLEIFSSNITGQNNAKNNSKTSLIVVPVSLVHNWINEINRFAPELSTFSFLNTNRTRNLNDLKDYDVVITTYGIIRNDIDILSLFKFHYIVLDESQNIKNPASKTYKAVSQLNSAHKLVLTGTPIENSLTDLWSQINFINRGLLGSLSFFKEEFQKPIEKLNSETHKEKLNKLIHPFILRRTKEEVVKELPPVNNQTLVCTMSPEQKSYYEKEKSKIRNTILHDIDAKGMGNTAIHILQALSKLRQISIHPKLIDQDYEFDSGKFNQITQDIENVIAEKHKILVFSSYVKHLNLIAAYLKENKVNYALLTGDIDQKKRETAINEFKENEKTPVFLISLKAGGTGLNLTQADYVFIIDPWWNPAAEWQAISRAHRIGQDKKVFVYRYISAGTVEEKITHLQEKKTKLADLFINSNNPFQSLSKADIEELFD